ncbi:hypothetical protein TEA_009688 [Camellia sinensis var. sinensis]|uniref:Uncharacterized protein n=1 Tax=Camellia sinensis var. sinensis TaxID=542762 RepID=A0A4S4EJY2_CAMSN|nr:hypothetical protein TEA_009688 [Camellia sinensis var. sinensis]
MGSTLAFLRVDPYLLMKFLEVLLEFRVDTSLSGVNTCLLLLSTRVDTNLGRVNPCILQNLSLVAHRPSSLSSTAITVPHCGPPSYRHGRYTTSPPIDFDSANLNVSSGLQNCEPSHHLSFKWNHCLGPTDGTLVATGGGDDKGFLWKIGQGDWAFELQGHSYHTEGLTCLTITSDSTLALTGSKDIPVHIVNITTGKV